MIETKKNIGVLLGDPSGIGPELISKLLTSKELEGANTIVIGEKNIYELGVSISKASTNIEYVDNFEDINFKKGNKFFLDISKGVNIKYELSKSSEESGKSVLNSLNVALDLAKQKKIHAINFGPFNKTSLKLGGL
jgi:Pyridoxal phosphate biosynthesis protein